MAHPPEPMSDCFHQGVDARAQGVARSDNPYCIRTEEHVEWDAGWRAVLDLDEDEDPTSLLERLPNRDP